MPAERSHLSDRLGHFCYHLHELVAFVGRNIVETAALFFNAFLLGQVQQHAETQCRPEVSLFIVVISKVACQELAENRVRQKDTVNQPSLKSGRAGDSRSHAMPHIGHYGIELKEGCNNRGVEVTVLIPVRVGATSISGTVSLDRMFGC